MPIQRFVWDLCADLQWMVMKLKCGDLERNKGFKLLIRAQVFMKTENIFAIEVLRN